MVVVQLLRVQSLGATEEYLLAAGSSGQQPIDSEVTEKLLTLPGRAEELPRATTATSSNEPIQPDQSSLDFAVARVAIPAFVQQDLDSQKPAIIGKIEACNLALFAEESEKLDNWAEDLKVALEREIKELDRRIKETRTKSKDAATLAEKLAAQKEQRDLEGQRDRKRRDLFTRQDEIQAKRDGLIDSLEVQLRQVVTAASSVQTDCWRLL